jgi:hypothetical protein
MSFLAPPKRKRFTAADVCNWIPCPGSGEGVNRWVYGRFLKCAEEGVDADEALNVIASRASRTGKPDELRRCQRKAYSGEDLGPTPVRSPYSPASLKSWVDRLPFQMSSKWLIEHSPANVDVSPGEFIEAIHPGRLALVVHPFKSTGGFVYRGEHEREELARYVAGNVDGVWYVANAVNGESEPIDWETQSDGKLKVTHWSLRSGSNIVDWSYAVLESDEVPGPEWCAMLVQQPDLAIVSLTYSGNDSVHALVRTGAKDKKEFAAFRRRVIERYSSLGLDPASVREVQLSRLPNVRNNKTGRMQKLLWLDPAAAAKPIVNNETKQLPQKENTQADENLRV